MFNKIFNFFLKEKPTQKKRITIIGEQRELGVKSKREQPIMERAVLAVNPCKTLDDKELSIYFKNAFNLYGGNCFNKTLDDRVKYLSSQR